VCKPVGPSAAKRIVRDGQRRAGRAFSGDDARNTPAVAAVV
jgi:hypothetical protein